MAHVVSLVFSKDLNFHFLSANIEDMHRLEKGFLRDLTKLKQERQVLCQKRALFPQAVTTGFRPYSYKYFCKHFNSAYPLKIIHTCKST